MGRLAGLSSSRMPALTCTKYEFGVAVQLVVVLSVRLGSGLAPRARR